MGRNKAECGSGWTVPQDGRPAKEGLKEGCVSEIIRVVRVEILEPCGDKRYDPSTKSYPVHNLEIEGDPSYSVSGLIVHNSCAGIKPQKDGWLGHLGDEVSFMQPSFLDAYANWYGKENFKGLLSANPTDLDDPSCIASEPGEGWDNWHDTEKTQEWRSKWYNAWVTCYDGRDSPNDDFPELTKPKFPYLISSKKRDAVAKSTGGKDSDLWMMQCAGKPRPGAEQLKVITRKLCEQNMAFESPVWSGKPRTRICGNDAAYGGMGGDRNVFIRIEFGEDIDGNELLAVYQPDICVLSARDPRPAEDKIAEWGKSYCESYDIPPENFFFDARASLGVKYSQIWSTAVNVVDFGGTASNRPVSEDEYIIDHETGQRRLKLCIEHYSKFVTELWWSVRYAIVSKQLRGLPRDVAAEGYKRMWKFTAGNRIEVESKKDMKERTKQSPDLFDALVIAVEGARRRGFQIKKLGSESTVEGPSDWFDKDANEWQDAIKGQLLEHEA